MNQEQNLPYAPLILVVDDDPAMHKLLAILLGASGYRLLHANDGSEALGCYESHHPDLILTDIVMPEHGGVALIYAIRAIDPVIPIIAMSALPNDHLSMVEKTGVNALICKPIEINELLSVISGLCELREQQADADIFGTDFQNLCVMVADDNAEFGAYLKTLLEGWGCRVQLARDGAEGLQLVQTARPDLVLTDLSMPVADGLELIMSIRRVDQTLPIIAMSGAFEERTDSYLRVTKKFGANDVLSKPFTADQLRIAMMQLIPDKEKC